MSVTPIFSFRPVLPSPVPKPILCVRQELAASLDISEGQVAKLLRWADDCQSSDKVLIAGGTTLGEIIP